MSSCSSVTEALQLPCGRRDAALVESCFRNCVKCSVDRKRRRLDSGPAVLTFRDDS